MTDADGSDVFEGEAGHTYEFLALATDVAGNSELPPFGAQAEDDGSSVNLGAAPSVPTFAFYELDGTWGIEGHGVEPDIEVLDDPAKMVDGADPQLERAIAELLSELETFDPPGDGRPAYPDRSGAGLPERDK